MQPGKSFLPRYRLSITITITITITQVTSLHSLHIFVMLIFYNGILEYSSPLSATSHKWIRWGKLKQYL